MPYAFLELDNARLHYHDAGGNGLPVLFIHAGVADLRMWDAQVDILAPRYHAIRYDVRGEGLSTAGPGPFAHHEGVRQRLDHFWKRCDVSAL